MNRLQNEIKQNYLEQDFIERNGKAILVLTVTIENRFLANLTLIYCQTTFCIVLVAIQKKTRIGLNTFHFFIFLASFFLFVFWSPFTSKALRDLKLRKNSFSVRGTTFLKQLSLKCNLKAVGVYLRKTRKFSKKIKMPQNHLLEVLGLLNTNLSTKNCQDVHLRIYTSNFGKT